MKYTHIRTFIVLAGVAVLIYMGGSYVLTPPPGIQKEDQGREHVSEADVAKFRYNSNPPTSGPHLVSWVKPGIYQTPQSDGELIHSLEHGYITISYNCNNDVISVPSGKQSTASAGMADPLFASVSATNPSADCAALVRQLESLAKKKKLFKLVVVPRPNQQDKIVLAAWTYIDTMNEYDEKRIVRFIDYHRNHGPEQTME